jgi:hypothetical protein
VERPGVVKAPDKQEEAADPTSLPENEKKKSTEKNIAL